MVLKLYGTSGSTCSKRVATILREKEVPYELVEINFAQGEQKTPEYLEKQPFGQVPYIVCLFDLFRCFCSHICNQDDDGFLLFESRAICRYIEAKYSKQGTSLIPTDPKANAKFEQAASIECFNFDPSASAIVYEAIFKKYGV